MSSAAAVDDFMQPEERSVEIVDARAMAMLNRSDVEAQLDAAHKYPRSIQKFMKDAQGMATLTRQIASSCIYALPRDGKTIPGPSVRLAEIAASAYGNLHIGARVVAAEDREVVAQGVCWDLEKNVRISVETRRRIVNKSGKRFNDDMITMTGNAAASVGLRNAIFRVIPRAYIDRIYLHARDASVGNASTLAQRRGEVVQELTKAGVPPERIFARIGRAGAMEITLEDLEILIGLQSAVESGERSIDELFPEVAGSSGGRVAAGAAGLEAAVRAQGAPPAAPAPAAAPSPAPAPARRGARAAAQPAASPANDAAPVQPPAAPGSSPGPVDPTGAPCSVCSKPVGDDAIATRGANGPSWRHPDCPPFGMMAAREPGEEG